MIEASERWQKEREAAAAPAQHAAKSLEQEAVQKQQDTETADLASSIAAEVEAPKQEKQYEMRESRVPSSRFGRLWQYGGLATSMAFGAMGEGVRRLAGGTGEGSLMLSEGNINRLVAKLSRMRGAALKLGQMISFSDSKVLPATISAVMQRVQDSADYMPASQRDRVLIRNLGPDWRDLFSDFAERPFAAASIGQVHKATLKSNGQAVAVKIQYPGVRNSIDSDLNNLSLLLTASQLLPRGLFLDKTIANARTELGWECDYTREAQACTRFKTELLADEPNVFSVPTVYPEASGPDVLTAEFMHGTAVTKIPDLTQSERDWIGTNLLRLCLRELMEWQFMQTDPNWTNFLYNRHPQPKLELLDFGASRDFPRSFVEPYVSLLIAASKGDREACRAYSIELGYLTGRESPAMLTAHVDSILVLAEPFLENAPEVYDFENQTITDRVRANIGLMLRERMAPPPEETYSLHRKLSGAFLLCAKLRSKVPAREMFADAVRVWEGGKGVKV
jgi:aarF domain-containing kinase